MKRFTRAYSSATTTLGAAPIPASKIKYIPTTGTYPKGFIASGVFVGVKPGNTSKPDLAIISSDRPCAAAGVFTKNKFQAAPVTFSRKLLQQKKNAGLRSVVINSGNANAVTGTGGLEDATNMARTTDQRVGDEDSTLVMSTGVIGQRFVSRSSSMRPQLADSTLGCLFKRLLTTSPWPITRLVTPTITG